MKKRVFTCFLMTFTGNGLARFGYVLLIPIMILSGRFNQNESFYIGIAILIGNIFCSVWIWFFLKFLSLENIAKLCFLIISLSFALFFFNGFAFQISLILGFFFGVTAGSLAILAPVLSLPHISPKIRSSINGLIFSGVGLGALFCGLTLPFVSQINTQFTWLFLAFISFICFIFSCFSLPNLDIQVKHSTAKKVKTKISYFLFLLIISYALNSIGYLPHSLFWTDYLVRSLHFSIHESGVSWMILGMGSFLGGLGSGVLADKIGLKKAHLIILIFKTLSCFIPILFNNLFMLDVSIFIMGFTLFGNITLTMSMGLEICGKEKFTQSSQILAFSFAIVQVIFSLIFLLWILPLVGYENLFIICGILTFLSALVLIPIKFKVVEK